jgi:putative MATE family efflux protein
MTPTLPDRPLWKTFLIFLGPMLVSNILQALSGTINNIYVGQMLGVRALASVAVFFPVLFFFIAFVIGLASGATVLVGQAWGARDMDKVKAVTGTTLGAGALLGCSVALVGGSFTHDILQALGTPPDIVPEATRYARVMFMAVPAMFVFILSTSMLRGTGDTVTPLKALILSSVVGLSLTPAFILGWGGLPQLGVTSPAWATVISMPVALAWMAWSLKRRAHVMALDAQLRRHFRLDLTLLKPVLRLGLPTGLFMVTSSSADLVLLSVVNGFGSNATATWGAVAQIMAYVQFPAMSISITSSILAAQAIGARQPERLNAITRTGLMMNLLLTGGLALLVALAARQMAGLFITSAPVLDLTESVLRITVLGSLFFGMASVFSGVMRASGTILIPTLISLGCLIGLLAPLGWMLSQWLGVHGVWMAYPITFLTALGLQALYFARVWKRKPIVRLV